MEIKREEIIKITLKDLTEQEFKVIVDALSDYDFLDEDKEIGYNLYNKLHNYSPKVGF